MKDEIGGLADSMVFRFNQSVLALDVLLRLLDLLSGSGICFESTWSRAVEVIRIPMYILRSCNSS